MSPLAEVLSRKLFREMPRPDPSPARLKREADAWLLRLTSGEATAGDATALERWRATSPAHRAAFAEAKLLWQNLGPAAEQAAGARASPAGWQHKSINPTRRRIFFGAAGVVSAAAVAAVMESPPFGLWPSLAELGAQYRTETGQQKRVVLSAASIELNTQTSINLSPSAADASRIELISGEAAIKANGGVLKPVVIVAGSGQASAENVTSFSVRYIASTACVTCVSGEVAVRCKNQDVVLQARQQIVYDDQGFGQITNIDPAVVMAWQKGFLVFRDVPLIDVIEDINRYRPGRIILVNDRIAKEAVFASFHINDIDAAISRMQTALGFHITSLPAGVLVIS